MSFAPGGLFGWLFFLFIVLPIAWWLIKLPFEIGGAIANRFEASFGIAAGIVVALTELAAVIFAGYVLIHSISFAPR
jgi:hypothetical protein